MVHDTVNNGPRKGCKLKKSKGLDGRPVGTRTPDLYRVKVALGWWKTVKVPVKLPLRVSDSDFNMGRQELDTRLRPGAALVRALGCEPSPPGNPGAEFDLNPSASSVMI